MPAMVHLIFTGVSLLCFPKRISVSGCPNKVDKIHILELISNV
jgi:hypothetical protein